MPITVDPSFIKASKQLGNSLQMVVAIEDLDTASDSLDSKSDWDASAVLLNIDTDEEDGSAIGQFHETVASNVSFDSTAVGPRYTFVAPTNGDFLHHIDFTRFFTSYFGPPTEISGNRNVTFTVRSGSHTGSILAQTSLVLFMSNIIIVVFPGEPTTFEYKYQFTGLVSPLLIASLTPSQTYYVQIEIQTNTINGTQQIGDLPRETEGVTDDSIFVPASGANCNLTTSTLDLGSVPTGDAIFSVDDIKESGVSIEYTILGDNVDPPTNDLGIVEDGDTITGYQYYDITAEFSSTTGRRGILQRLELSTSEKNYIVNRPVEGLSKARVLLLPSPLREISTKLDREKPTSVGEMDIQMAWTAWLGGIIHDEFLRGKDVSIDIGYDEISLSQFAPFFRGTWYDYRADHVKGFINVQLRNVLDQWRKVKLPKETSDSDGNKTTAPIEYIDHNIFDVMLNLFDKIGFPDRYIARDEFEFLRDVEFNLPDYEVTRTITKPIEAFKLLNELSVISGVFLVPYADGKIYPIVYDPNAPQAAVFDANFMDFETIKGGYKDLFTRQLIYFDPSVVPPGDDEDDYDSLYIDLDATIETLWDESNEKRWFEKWNASFVLVSSLANRFHSWFATPKKAFEVNKVNLRFIELQPGDIVHVNNLHIPVTEADFPGTTDDVHCLILNRSLNPSNGALSYSLVEVEEPQQCFPISVDVLTGAGIGNIDNMQVKDEVYYQVEEVTGVPGFEVQLDMNCPEPLLREFVFWGRYIGNPAHNKKVQVYEVGATSPDWVDLRTGTDDLPSAATDYFLRIPFFFGASYFSQNTDGTYNIKIRIIHTSSGSNTHDLYIDQLFLR